MGGGGVGAPGIFTVMPWIFVYCKLGRCVSLGQGTWQFHLRPVVPDLLHASSKAPEEGGQGFLWFSTNGMMLTYGHPLVQDFLKFLKDLKGS